MGKLENKVAIVTGGASGIGKAICKLFAEEGAKVVIADINIDNGKKVEKEIKGSLFVKCDVTKAIEVKDIAYSLGLVAESESPIYRASKAALVHLTKAMALDYVKDGIRVNCVCPGPIDTPLLRGAFPNEKALEDYIQRQTPMKRIGKPEEVAKVVLFLASDDSSYITGSAYSIDGGEGLR